MTARIEITAALECVPVVELEPLPYWRLAHPDVAGVSEFVPTWHEAVRGAGIVANPIREDSWLVRVEDLADDVSLRSFLDVYPRSHAQIEPAPGQRRLTPAAGGIALIDGAEFFIVPDCCCELDTIHEWEDAARLVFEFFYVGHAELQARWDDPWIVLSYETPGGVPDVEWRVRPPHLAQALQRARVVQEAFAARLARVLQRDMSSDHAMQVAATLAGLIRS